ncbi:MAG: DUF1501 domain-containing protein [Acidobacteriota bacterium]
MAHSRRDFLARTTCAALSAAAAQASMRKLGLMNLLAKPSGPTDYRALVCIFLDGGNDGNNLIVPTDSAHYNEYLAARPLSSGLGLDAASLLQVGTPPSFTGTGRTFGFHPSLIELQSLYTQSKLGVVCNVGPLVEPLTQADYVDGTKPVPYSLFSHSDQVSCWQTSQAVQPIATGWGGRMADATIGCNSASSFPTLTSISGATTFCIGIDTTPLAIETGALDQVLVLNGFYGSPEDTARRNAMDFARTIDRTAVLIAAASDTTQQGVDISAAFASDPQLNTVFPDSYLGQQLLQVAKIIKLNQSSLLLNRQIFYVEQGGYDTHQDQASDQANQLIELSQAMSAFYAAMVELSVQNSVTAFTLSDFGRTLEPSGDVGSVGTDHGWGSHQFVLGGAVSGANFYGNPGSNGTAFPTLVIGGLDDTSPDDRGRWIPTSAVEQYGATLASWFGVSGPDLATVFPLIGNFGSSNLGFMGAPGSVCL